MPCQTVIVDVVQKYIDPNDQGKTVTKDGHTYNLGDGLGEGVANIGAHFTAVPAFEHLINISADVELSPGTDISNARISIENAISTYFKELVFASNDNDNMTVSYNRINALVTMSVPEIIDFKNLRINSKSENITVSPEYVPKVGVVTLNEIV